MNAFESTADMTGPAVPVTELRVAGRLADGVWLHRDVGEQKPKELTGAV